MTLNDTDLVHRLPTLQTYTLLILLTAFHISQVHMTTVYSEWVDS